MIGRAAKERECVCVCVWAGRMMREKERVRECSSGKMRERERGVPRERKREKMYRPDFPIFNPLSDFFIRSRLWWTIIDMNKGLLSDLFYIFIALRQ